MGTFYPAIVFPLCLAWLALMGRHALDLRKEQKYRSSWGWVFFAFLPAAISALYLLPIAGAPVEVRNVTLGAIGCLVGGSLFVWGGYAWSDYFSNRELSQPSQRAGVPFLQEAQLAPGCSNSVGGNNSGPMTNNCNFNFGSQPRELNNHEELKAQILKEVPKDKPIIVVCVLGDSEAFSFAQQIYAFLKTNNFPLAEPEGMSGGVDQAVFTSPVKGLQLRDDGKTRSFIVGSNK